MATFAELVRKAGAMTPGGFARAFPGPAFFVQVGPGVGTDSMGFTTTNAVDPQTGGLLPAERIEWIRKRDQSNSFMHMVTIGRAVNNDVVLDGQGVSKFHAYVLQEKGQHLLVDAGSSFGTVVGGQKLRPREERRPLAGGDAVQIGALSLTFHTPASLYAALRGRPG